MTSRTYPLRPKRYALPFLCKYTSQSGFACVPYLSGKSQLTSKFTFIDKFKAITIMEIHYQYREYKITQKSTSALCNIPTLFFVLIEIIVCPSLCPNSKILSLITSILESSSGHFTLHFHRLQGQFFFLYKHLMVGSFSCNVIFICIVESSRKQKHLLKFTTQQKKEVNSMMLALSHDTNNFNIKIQTI